MDRIGRITRIGADPADTPEQQSHKSMMTMIAVITTPLVLVWTIVYGVLGFPWSAAIPAVYAAMTIVGLVVLARTERIEFLRTTQMTMWLVFPFLLQWTLGGFANSSAVAMWALGAPLLAHIVGAKAWPWFVGFAGLTVVAGLIDGWLAARAPDVPEAVITVFFVLTFLGIGFVVFVALQTFIVEEQRAKEALDAERRRSDALLLNVLPAHIAERLKDGEEPIADRIDQVTVVVADIVGFTPISERVEPDVVVQVLNDLFSGFDDLTVEYGLEKLKTIGDAYQAVGGLPGSNPDQVAAAADLALAMQQAVHDHAFPGFDGIQLRIGINTGPVVAGVIGKRKFSYDLWGDTINTASRMESHGVPGRIQVTEAVRRQLDGRFELVPRGEIEVKGKGPMTTYFLEGEVRSARRPDVLGDDVEILP